MKLLCEFNPNIGEMHVYKAKKQRGRAEKREGWFWMTASQRALCFHYKRDINYGREQNKYKAENHYQCRYMKEEHKNRRSLRYLDKQQQKQQKMHKWRRISCSCCGNEPVILKQMGVGGPDLFSFHYTLLHWWSQSGECNYSVDMSHASFCSLTLLGHKTGQ